MSRNYLIMILIYGALSLQGQQVSTIAGRMDVGGWQDAAASNALFNNPHGLTRDAVGNLYVADRFNHVIRMVSTTGEVSTYAGQAGISGAADGSVGEATFNEPWGLNVANDGSLLVADTRNNLIRRISPEGIVTTLAGTGAYGFTDGMATQASFGNPTDLVQATNGNIYVVDHLTHVIRQISPDGMVSTLAGQGDMPGNSDGQGNVARFFRPYGLDLDLDGNIIVADEWNHLIRRVTPAGVVSTIAGTGEIAWRDGQASDAAFNFPWDVAVDAAGNIWVGDGYNYLIRQISPAGWVTTIAGLPQESGEVDGPALAASFDGPTSLVMDPTSTTLWIADAYNHTIRQLSPLQTCGLSLSFTSPSTTFCAEQIIPLQIQGGLGSLTRLILNRQDIIVVDTVAPALNDLPPGDYSIQVQTQLSNGQQRVSNTLNFTIVAAPELAIATPDGTELEPESTLRLEALSTDEIRWSTGEESSTILVDEPGWYSVNTMGDVCPVLTESVEITLVEIEEVEEEVEEEIYLGDPWLPTAFTPNGDGINDVFRIRGLAPDAPVVFRVYDRWGQELFYSSSAATGWDGYYRNRRALPDTYSYTLCYPGQDGVEQLVRGQVYLQP